ncbi:MAG: hypothetical protein ABL909_02810 [Sphingopyxis sp.]
MIKPAQIVFGTMRMHEIERSSDEWADFLMEIHACGVRALHSSDEYDSFPLLCDVLTRLRERRPDIGFRHVVKLAEPSFDDTRFDAERLAAKLERYKAALGSATIHDVQWMWRKDLKAEAQRLADLHAAAPDIIASTAQLKRSGAIERFFCFPYSTAFADEAMKLGCFDGLVVYRNTNEREYDYLLEPCLAAGGKFLVIRPFAAGQALGAGLPTPREQLGAALDHAAIESAILSTSSLRHLDDLLG